MVYRRDYGSCPVCDGHLVLDGLDLLRTYVRCRGRHGLEDGCGFTELR